MNYRQLFIAFSFFVFSLTDSFAQEIPIGTWRAHISYNSVYDITFGDNKVFASASNGVMAFDISDKSVSNVNKVNGLSGSQITSIAFHEAGKTLLISYADGMLDLVRGNEVTSFDRLKNSTTISGSKKLNSIHVQNGFAYIAADFGVVVFDVERGEVKETWRDLGAGGARLQINEITFRGDSIFLATAKGVMAGDQRDNLLDFNLWKRFDQTAFNTSVASVASFNGFIYAAINGSGIYRYENGAWTKEPYLQNLNYQSLFASPAHLLIAQGGQLWQLNTSAQLEEIVSDKLVLPNVAKEDNAGKLWVGDNVNGLLTNMNGDFTSVILNGPSTSTTYRLNFDNGKLFALPGGPNGSGQPLRNAGRLDSFENGRWENDEREVLDLTDIDPTTSETFIASFGYGLEKTSGNTSAILDESNSGLINLNPPGRFVNISAIERSSDGLWVANYGTPASLHLLKNDGTWESHSFPITAARYPTDLLVDEYGYVWMILNPSQGGGILIYDREEDRYAYLTNTIGAGGLPSKNVRSIAIDRDGYVWVGTDQGVAYFLYPPDVFEPGIDAIKPIFENRFLLKDDKVTAIKVDGGNRKWMATERGVWLFDAVGEKEIYNFTAANSPLLSDLVRDVEIVPATGEVFFATDAGIVSFRSGATSGESSFQTVKIFPNPVTKEFSGVVGISGLATDAIVKITDVSGKLIWQTQANGGTATWNVQDYKGRRATTGIYLVFAATSDGSESVVGKLAVID
jgi:hypothetical protein